MKAPFPFSATHPVDADVSANVPSCSDVMFEIAVVLAVTLAIALAANLGLEIAGLQ